jgi:hypothetical protein
LRARRFSEAVDADFNEIASYADTIPAFVLRREALGQVETVRVLYQEMLWLEDAIGRRDPEFFDRFLPFRVAVLAITPEITALPLFLEDPYWFGTYLEALPAVREATRSMVTIFPGRIFGQPAAQASARKDAFDERADRFLQGTDLSTPSFGSAQNVQDYADYLLRTMRTMVGVPTGSTSVEDLRRSVARGREFATDLVETLEDFTIMDDIQLWDARVQFFENQDWSWYADGEQIRQEKLNEAIWIKAGQAMAGRNPESALPLWYVAQPADALPESFEGPVTFTEKLFFEGQSRYNDVPQRSTSIQWRGDDDQVLSVGQALNMGVSLSAERIAGGVRGRVVIDEADGSALCYIIVQVNGQTVYNQLNSDADRFRGSSFFQVPEEVLQVGWNEFVFGIISAGEDGARARLDHMLASWE